MKPTLIIAAMLLSDWAAAAKPNRQYPCSRTSCEIVAKHAGLPFSVQQKSNGAPAGCIRYNDGRVIWVRTCVNHVNCDTERCNGCRVFSDDVCRGQEKVLASGCGDNSTKEGNWCKCYPGFKMNINPKYNKPYGGWDSMYHFNARNTEGFYCVPNEDYLNSYLTSPCGKENESCNCDGMILYGQGGSWGEFFKNGYALRFNTGAVQCGNGEFGDPLFGTKKRCVCVSGKKCDDNSEKQGNWCQCKQGFRTKLNEKGKPFGGWPTRYHFNAVGKAGFVCEKPTPKPTPAPPTPKPTIAAPAPPALRACTYGGYTCNKCVECSGCWTCKGSESQDVKFCNVGAQVNHFNPGGTQCFKNGEPVPSRPKEREAFKPVLIHDGAHCSAYVNLGNAKSLIECGERVMTDDRCAPYYFHVLREDSGAYRNCGCVKPSDPTCSKKSGGNTYKIYKYAPAVYKKGSKGDNDCPEGYAHITTTAECEQAFEELDGSLHRTPVGSWGHVPPYCSYQSGGDKSVHFNRNALGKNDGGYSPICKLQPKERKPAPCYKLTAAECCAHKDSRPQWASDCVITTNVQKPSWDRKNQCQPESFVRPAKYGRGKTGFVGDVVDCEYAAPAEVGCKESLKKNFDIKSGRFRRVTGVAQPARTASDKDCADLCRNTFGCQYFVRQPSSGSCWRGTGLDASVVQEAENDRNLGYVCPYEFTLRGDTGEEVVEYQGKTYSIGTEPTIFKSAYPKTTLEFVNDGRTGSDKDKNVRFATGNKVSLSVAGSLWSGWKCGSSDENERCDWVRDGIFAWNAVYNIDFQKSGTRRMEQEDIARRLLGNEEYVNSL